MYLEQLINFSNASSVQHRLSVPNKSHRHFTGSSVFTCETSQTGHCIRGVSMSFINTTSAILRFGCSPVNFWRNRNVVGYLSFHCIQNCSAKNCTWRHLGLIVSLDSDRRKCFYRLNYFLSQDSCRWKYSRGISGPEDTAVKDLELIIAHTSAIHSTSCVSPLLGILLNIDSSMLRAIHIILSQGALMWRMRCVESPHSVIWTDICSQAHLQCW